MSEPIGPGDLVECVDASPGVGREANQIVLGALYTVEKCIQIVFWNKSGVKLVGNDGRWLASRFRPISRRSSFESFLTQIKAPREDVGADEAVGV